MTDWSEVKDEHVRGAIAECDRLGKREFLLRYRFGRARDASLWHGGQEYDARAVLGLAYLRATGHTVPSEEFAGGGEDGAVLRLKALGFDVVVDETLTPPPPKPRKSAASAGRSSATKTAAARTPAVKAAPPRRVVRSGRTGAAMPEPEICPTCYMAIPSTGVCDNCG